MIETKHSPLPWIMPHFTREDSGCKCGFLFAENQDFMGAIATIHFSPMPDKPNDADDPPMEEAKANAALIVLAVNNHEALVKCLKDLMASASGGEKSCGHDFNCICAGDKARALLAKLYAK